MTFRVSSKDGERVKEIVTGLILGEQTEDAPARTTPTAVPEQAAASDPAEQLKKLADLHQSGLLTDEEFAAKRAALVDKL